MLRLSVHRNDHCWHTVTQVTFPGADPLPPTLLVTEAACLLADPVLYELDVELEASSAASTTSILPPNWKLLFFT